MTETSPQPQFLQPWMVLLVMPLIGLIAMIVIITTDANSADDIGQTSNQQSVFLDDATPRPQTLPPRTPAPTSTSIFNIAAPDLPLESLDGETFTLADFRGKVVVLNFWATWCTPCIDEMPDLQAFYDEYPDDDLAMVLVTDPQGGQTPEEVATFVETLEIRLPIGFTAASALNNAMGVRILPSTFFIDKDGVTRGYWIGPIEVDDLENEVALLLE